MNDIQIMTADDMVILISDPWFRRGEGARAVWLVCRVPRDMVGSLAVCVFKPN